MLKNLNALLKYYIQRRLNCIVQSTYFTRKQIILSDFKKSKKNNMHIIRNNIQNSLNNIRFKKTDCFKEVCEL